MTSQEKNDLIMKCLSKRRNINIDRAYELAIMAIEGRYPDEGFDEDECEVWSEYRWVLKAYIP